MAEKMDPNAAAKPANHQDKLGASIMHIEATKAITTEYIPNPNTCLISTLI
jgi:hypothetical protein